MLMQADWSKLKNILCIRLDNLGDVIMTSPALKALKESVPGRKLTLLTSRAGSLVAQFIPSIDEVIVFDTPWEKNTHQGSAEGVDQIVKLLTERTFDGAVIFTVYSQNPLPSAMICYLAQIPHVAGYCRENPYKLINTWIPEFEPLYEIKHEVERQLHLVRLLDAKVESDELDVKLPESAEHLIKGKLLDLNVDTTRPFVLIHPGVSEAKRQYPVESFAKAAKTIALELGYQVLLTGVESEKDLTEFIAKEVGAAAISLAGKLSLDELLALIKISPLLISNNTGPVHIAAAFKTPVIVLYALTNPQHTPWKVPHKVLQFDVPEHLRSKNVIISFAYQKSFTNPRGTVFPEEIVDAAKQLLGIEILLKE